jgi:tRNA acetyltransferase TAN1
VQNKEMIAEREIIDALEEAADELYPSTGGGADEEEEGGDIEDMLKRELEGLASHKTRQSQRFRVCKRETGCSELPVHLSQLTSVLYINVLPPLDPIALVRHIIERCERTARCSFRFIQRLTPVSSTSHADMAGLRRIASEVLPGPFSGGPKKVRSPSASRADSSSQSRWRRATRTPWSGWR